MRQKISGLFLTLILLISLPITASADILWEPLENDYYETHGGNFQSYKDRTYVVPEGMTANLYQSPETGGLIKTLVAGTRIYIGPCSEINGETWAAGYPYGDWENEGWVRLDRLQLEYDHEDFLEDFADDITSSDAILAGAAIPVTELNGKVQTWTYPGSGLSDRTLTFDGTEESYNDGMLTFTRIYTDPNGGQWGYIGYYMGRCGWAYLEDLYSTNPPTSPQTLESTVTDTAPEEDDPILTSLKWTIIPVIILVVGTAAVIVRCKRRK